MKPVINIAELREGQMCSQTVDGVDVLLCLVEGQFYALHNQCSHAGQRLAQGRLKGFEVICPLHGARFDVRTGACVASPATRGISRFPVLLERGKVLVGVGDFSSR